MTKPLLSVAIITYNQEKFISQTLDSILNQNHGYTYEIVIGEDCSSDGTKSVIEKYVRKYPEIIKPIFNNPNKGLIKNYYNVIDNCTGKYIMECAGDDYWLPGKVVTQIEYMERHPEIGMCYGQAKNYDEIAHVMTDEVVGRKCETYENLFIGNTIPALTVCFRKDLITQYQSDVEPVKKDWRMEDLPQWLYFSKESEIKFLPKVFGVYRMQSESGSHFVDTEKKQKYEDSCFEIRKYFANKYGTEILLNNYKCHWGFIEAWQNKNRDALLEFSKDLPKKDINLKNLIKISIAKNKFLFEKIFSK